MFDGLLVGFTANSVDLANFGQNDGLPIIKSTANSILVGKIYLLFYEKVGIR